jgi:hypothetical protein
MAAKKKTRPAPKLVRKAVTRRQDKNVSRTLRMYGTYSFVTKDPVIDELRTIIQDLAKREGVSFNVMCKRLSIASSVSLAAIMGWFKGKTRRPQSASIEAVGRAAGKRRTWTD